MNTSEWEQGMKRLLDEQEYTPEDAAWVRMQEALHPAAPAATRPLLLFPAWKKAAAAAALLALCGTSYLLLRRGAPEHAPAVTASHQHTPAPVHTTNSTPGPVPPIAATPMSPQAACGATPAARLAGTGKPAVAILPLQKEPQPAAQTTPAPLVTSRADAPPEQPVQKGQQASQQRANFYPYGEPELKPGINKPLDIGVAANVGKPNLGNVQYAVGIVARKQLSERFFAEANVSLASTQVNYARHFTASGNGSYSSEDGTGLPGLSNSGAVASRSDISISYANNVMAVGIAPAFGINASKNVAVSLGLDVYKTLNRDLSVQTDLGAIGFEDASSVPGLKVTDLDAGVKAQLDYHLGKKLSLSTLYRQGLTHYIIIDGKTAKNSSFNIGLKYFIGK